MSQKTMMGCALVVGLAAACAEQADDIEPPAPAPRCLAEGDYDVVLSAVDSTCSDDVVLWSDGWYYCVVPPIDRAQPTAARRREDLACRPPARLVTTWTLYAACDAADVSGTYDVAWERDTSLARAALAGDSDAAGETMTLVGDATDLYQETAWLDGVFTLIDTRRFEGELLVTRRGLDGAHCEERYQVVAAR